MSEIILRTATIKDAPQLMAWRNDPLTVAMSVTKREVTTREHLAWLKRFLKQPGAHLYLAYRRGAGLKPKLIGI